MFLHRHGIDLDNPGPGGTSSLLLALESQASQVAAAAAAAGFVPGLNAVAAAAAAVAASAHNANNSNNSVNVPNSHQSDSGESLRSLDNATPPMHFLTPHVEISTLPDAATNGGGDIFNVTSDCLKSSVENALLCVFRAFALQGNNSNSNASSGVNGSGVDYMDGRLGSDAAGLMVQDQPLDCNTKSQPSSTSSNGGGVLSGRSVSPRNHHHHHHENHITPSISLIPIKQVSFSKLISNIKELR